MVNLSPGILLIADPFLKDPNFARTVVLLCEHQDKGSFGFVINKIFDQRLDELVPDVVMPNIPVYYGGPVQMDTIHFVHQQPHLIKGGLEVIPGIYWGGNFEDVVNINSTIIFKEVPKERDPYLRNFLGRGIMGAIFPVY